MSTNSPTQQQQNSAQPEPTNDLGDQPPTTDTNSASGVPFMSRGEPKHVLQGVVSAGQSILSGVGVGGAALVGAPIAGYQEEGAYGAAKGVLLGVAGLAVCSLFGVAQGSVQLYKGVVNTGEAVKESYKGEKFWDSKRNKWIDVNLPVDFDTLPDDDTDIMRAAQALFNEQEAEDKGEASADEHPATESAKELYTILQVAPTATDAEIRKAYMRRAVETHPDKNADNPNAKAEFEAVKDAYNVLHDPVSRAAYDRDGSINHNDDSTDEIDTFLNALGFNFLKPFVGIPGLLYTFKRNCCFSNDMYVKLHVRRRLRITQFFMELFRDPFNEARVRVVVTDAVSTPLGPSVLGFVAEECVVAIRQFTSSALMRELDSFFTSKSLTAQTYYNYVSALTTAIKKASRSASLDEKDALALIVLAAEGDIRRTVLQSVRLMFYDQSASLDEKKRRCDCLARFAEITVEEVKKEIDRRKLDQQQLLASETSE